MPTHLSDPPLIPYPRDLDGFDICGQMLDGRSVVVARRNGITWIFVKHEDGRWDADKIQGGKVIGRTRKSKELPRALTGPITRPETIARRLK